MRNRIAFPKKFREELGNKLIITRGYEGCAILMSPAQWEEMVSDLYQALSVSESIRDTRRFLLAGASEIELDAQGRFVVPPYLVEYSEIKVEGTFLGLGDWVELWSTDKWEEKRKQVESNSSSIGERLAEIQASNMNYKHISVLLNEAVEGLNVKKNGKYIDCNLGGGGHTAKILELGGNVLALDIDESAVEYCRDKFSSEIRSGHLKIAKANFKRIRHVAKEHGWKGSEIDGVLYDLGLSTFQIKQSAKGFSFEDRTELDMRMDSQLGVKAIDLLVVLPESDLTSIISDYGDEPQAKIFARAIKKLVKQKGREITAFQLAEVIKNSSRYRVSRLHPATRVFQALRIAVNSELSNLESSVEDAADLLKVGGRLSIITFHSLEDR